MEWIPVSSDNISRVRYDEESLTLEIEFNNGRVYQFLDVPTQVFDSLMAADSHGQFFHAQIKGNYRFVRM